MPSREVLAHLSNEIRRPDPWLLETNSYEQARYDAMISLIAYHPKFKYGLEVGCAAGAFTSRLLDRCQKLRLVDIMPEAIERCQARFKGQSHLVFTVDDIASCGGWGETYDLIVVSEVLYYLEQRELIDRSIALLASLLCEDGVLLFGSVVDEVAWRWGMYGAETAMATWSQYLIEEHRLHCVGALPDENSTLVRYACYDNNSYRFMWS